MMKARLKSKWLKALRSGKFKQTEGELHNHEGYCCLGVLRAICTEPKLRKEPGDELIDLLQLPKIGLTEKQQTRLATMNDYGQSFTKIAKWIEKYC